MWGKLILNSFRRDVRRKAVAMAAVILATALATFLLNWAINLGDKIQSDLRAYGANIVVVPAGQTIPIESEIELTSEAGQSYLNAADLANLKTMFWKNQIVAYSPALYEPVQSQNKRLIIAGVEFGKNDPAASLSKTSPYISIKGKWPENDTQAITGSLLADGFGWKIGQKIQVSGSVKTLTLNLTGILYSGGPEENRLFTTLQNAQALNGNEGKFNEVSVSALVTPKNRLYERYHQNPKSLTPVEYERYSCTPYITSVASEIQEAIPGAESRIVRQISEAEEKIARKVNWLMIMITLAAIVASSLTMTSTTTAMILERKKELALMKAIGSQSGFILLYLFSSISVSPAKIKIGAISTSRASSALRPFG